MYAQLFTHPNHVPYTDEQLARMKHMYEIERKSSVVIGQIFGIDASCVTARLKKMGVIIRKGGSQRRFTDAVCEEIVNDKEEGYTIEYLAAKHNCSMRKICYALQWGRKIRTMKQARQ
jgi:hypothetical protein